MKRFLIYCWLLFLAVLGPISHAQTELDRLKEKAFQADNRLDYDSAIYYKNRVGELLLANQDSVGYLKNKITIGIYQANKGDFRQGVATLNQVLQSSENLTGGNLLFETYSALSSLYAYRNYLTEAEDFLNLARDNFKPSEAREASTRMGKFYFDEATIYQRQGKALKAKLTYEKALTVFDSLAYNNPFHAGILYSLAGANNSIGLFSEAIDQVKRSIYMTENFFEDPDHPSLILKYYGLADILSSQNLEHEAIEFWNRAMRISLKGAPNDPYSHAIRSKLSDSHLALGNTATSLQLKNNNLQERIERFGANSSQVADSYYELANHFALQKDFDEAIRHFQEADQLFKKLPNRRKELLYVRVYLGINLLRSGKTEGINLISQTLPNLIELIEAEKYQLVLLYMNLADAHLEMARYEDALSYYQQAMISGARGFEKTHYSQNPSVASITDPREQLAAFVGKAKALQGNFQQTGSVEHLDAAYNTIASADSLADILRSTPNAFSDKTGFQTIVSEVNGIGISLCHDLFQKTNDRAYLDQAFRFSEKNKYNLILSNLEEMLFLKQSNIPDSLVNNLQSSVNKISYMEAQMYQEEQEKKEDSSQRALYENDLILYRAEKRRILETLEKAFPSYYEIKHRQNLSNINALQNSLDSTQLLISYHLSKQSLNIFRISRHSVEWTVEVLNHDFHAKIQSYIALLNSPQKDVRRFVKVSSDLREMLLPAGENLSQFKSLIIIPDGPLGQIPFGTLVSSVGNAENFKELEYLVKTHSINYANSVTLLEKQRERSAPRFLESAKVLAFAPSFDQSQVTDSRGTDSTLSVLSWTEGEVKAIDRHFRTDAFFGKSATEQQFRSRSSDYSILHVASHGILNEQNPLFSKLIFYPHETDSVNDGFLNTGEVFNLEIPAEMVVLSACNTGVGEVLTGEGVISLANSFFYAGAKSLVMTLWTANDQSSAVIMDNFYHNLKLGNSKSQALTNAKLEYLEQADGLFSHPYYWAHFVFNGDDRPLKQSAKNGYLWFILLVPVAFLLIRKAQTRQSKA